MNVSSGNARVVFVANNSGIFGGNPASRAVFLFYIPWRPLVSLPVKRHNEGIICFILADMRHILHLLALSGILKEALCFQKKKRNGIYNTTGR